MTAAAAEVVWEVTVRANLGGKTHSTAHSRGQAPLDDKTTCT